MNFQFQNSKKITTGSRNQEEQVYNKNINNIINPNILKDFFEYNLQSIDLFTTLRITYLKYSFSQLKK